MAQVIEFAAFKLPSAVETAFEARAEAAKKADGFIQQYAGSKIEDPTSGVHVTVWSSAAAQKAWASTAAAAKVGGAGPLLVEVLGGSTTDGTPLSALGAPCTEVFTGYNVDTSVFPAAVRTFRSRMDAPAARPVGYVASGVLDSVVDVAPAQASQSRWAGPATKLIIGWPSREAHMKAKGLPGPIMDNIGLLRDGYSAGDMYHAKFRAL